MPHESNLWAETEDIEATLRLLEKAALVRAQGHHSASVRLGLGECPHIDLGTDRRLARHPNGCLWKRDLTDTSLAPPGDPDHAQDFLG